MKRTSPQPRPHSFTRVQSESAMRRKSEEKNPAVNLITTPNPVNYMITDIMNQLILSCIAERKIICIKQCS